MEAHGIRIESPSLEYVNKSETKWACCIGVPYGTPKWQVFDSKYQEGLYKIMSA